MKYVWLIIFTVLSTITNTISCIEGKTVNVNTEKIHTMEHSKIRITVNSKTFTATLMDNKSAKAFKDLLPLTITMNELNGNEKYYDLSNSLPTNSTNPRTIKNGDLMLYGSKTLVLFYKTFPTSYAYSKLGNVDDVTGLVTALGSGDVSVSFEIEKK